MRGQESAVVPFAQMGDKVMEKQMIRRALSLELLRKFRAESQLRERTRRHGPELDNLRQVSRRSRAHNNLSTRGDQTLRRKLRQVSRYS